MLTSMKSLVTILSCILAVSAIATPEVETQLEKRSISDRIRDPLADFTVATVDAMADSIDTSKSPDASLDLKGFTLLSSFTNAGVTFGKWSESSDSSTSKRSNWNRDIPDIPQDLEKRSTDIQGRFCASQCAYQNFTHADPNDCKNVYQGIYSTTGVFTLPAKQAMTVNSGNCAVVIINNSDQDIVYDYWDFAGTGQWLNGDCVVNGATIGICLYSGIGSTVRDGIYTSVNHPGFFTN